MVEMVPFLRVGMRHVGRWVWFNLWIKEERHLHYFLQGLEVLGLCGFDSGIIVCFTHPLAIRGIEDGALYLSSYLPHP